LFGPYRYPAAVPVPSSSNVEGDIEG